MREADGTLLDVGDDAVVALLLLLAASVSLDAEVWFALVKKVDDTEADGDKDVTLLLLLAAFVSLGVRL